MDDILLRETWPEIIRLRKQKDIMDKVRRNGNI